MSRSETAVQLGSEFNAFLFAPVGDEKNGMVLTVLSALARLDVDPWREAAALARMPRAAANRRLSSLIAALPDAPSTSSPPAIIADRLIPLLPRGEISGFVPRAKLLGGNAPLNFQRIARLVAINLLLVAGILCVEWALGSVKPWPDADITQIQAASAASLPTSPPGTNH